MSEQQPDPIAYTALKAGTPVQTSTGTEFGTVERVLDIAEQDLFDGIVVATQRGARFVDADQVDRITSGYVRCTIGDDEVSSLPPPQGNPVFRADAGRDLGGGFGGWFRRTFTRARWTKQ